MKKKRIPENLDYAAKHIRCAFDHWHQTDVIGTVGDLLTTLQEVIDEMSQFEGDALIVDHWDNLGITTEYINLFGDPDDHQDDDWPLTFDYRLANVEEDIMYVEQLVEGLGESFKFDDLPKPEYMTTAA